MTNRGRPRKMTVKKIAAAKRLLHEGVLTNDEIAAKLDISRSYFYKTIPSPRSAVTNKRVRTPDWMKQCEALLVQTNMSVRQIATHLGISRATVYKKFPRIARRGFTQKKRSNRMKINILVVTIIFAASASAHAQYYADPHLYYTVGGGRATTPPIIDPSMRYRFRAPASGFACSIFDPKLDIRSMLGGIGNSMADLGSLKSSLTGALPGQVLCRAQPSLCQLIGTTPIM